jgi:sugar fermentation stimulation protein A
MRYDCPVYPATFLERRNRFVAVVDVGGRVTTALVPTTGRLAELLVPGAPARVGVAKNPNRKHALDLLQVRYRRTWANLTAIHANKLFGEAVVDGLFPELTGWRLERAEIPVGRSRFDWLLARGERRMYVEVKSVTLVEGGVGIFPDAPTQRGARHLRELAELVAAGHAAAAAFIVQRADANLVRPNDRTDPDFAAALRAAAAAGVVTLAARCRVTKHGVAVIDPLPVVP